MSRPYAAKMVRTPLGEKNSKMSGAPCLDCESTSCSSGGF